MAAHVAAANWLASSVRLLQARVTALERVSTPISAPLVQHVAVPATPPRTVPKQSPRTPVKTISLADSIDFPEQQQKQVSFSWNPDVIEFVPATRCNVPASTCCDSNPPTSEVIASAFGSGGRCSADGTSQVDMVVDAAGHLLQDLRHHFPAVYGFSLRDAYEATARHHARLLLDPDNLPDHPDFDDFIACCTKGPVRYTASFVNFCRYFNLSTWSEQMDVDEEELHAELSNEEDETDYSDEADDDEYDPFPVLPIIGGYNGWSFEARVAWSRLPGTYRRGAPWIYGLSVDEALREYRQVNGDYEHYDGFDASVPVHAAVASPAPFLCKHCRVSGCPGGIFCRQFPRS